MANIYEIIDTANINQEFLDQTLRIQIVEEYKLEQWIAVGKFWCRHLAQPHDVPGQVVDTIIGIIEYYRQHESLTVKQRHYLVNNLIDHWDQLSLSARAELML